MSKSPLPAKSAHAGLYRKRCRIGPIVRFRFGNRLWLAVGCDGFKPRMVLQGVELRPNTKARHLTQECSCERSANCRFQACNPTGIESRCPSKCRDDLFCTFDVGNGTRSFASKLQHSICVNQFATGQKECCRHHCQGRALVFETWWRQTMGGLEHRDSHILTFLDIREALRCRASELLAESQSTVAQDLHCNALKAFEAQSARHVLHPADARMLLPLVPDASTCSA
jgi:hypothetical protein